MTQNYTLKPPYRIVVVGSSCSGKTTLARQLAHQLEIKHIELDSLHWLPHWTKRDTADFRRVTAEAISAGNWALDGNYHKVRDLSWARATAIIWLNYSFPLVYYRAIKRTMKRVITREELFSGNRESVRLTFFSRDSLLWWIITTYKRRKAEYRAIFDTGIEGVQLIEFQHPQQTVDFLASLGRTD